MKTRFHLKKTILAITLIMTAALFFSSVMTIMVPNYTFAKDDDDQGEDDDDQGIGVPDASVMWLLGPSLLLLGLLRRRKPKN